MYSFTCTSSLIPRSDRITLTVGVMVPLYVWSVQAVFLCPTAKVDILSTFYKIIEIIHFHHPSVNNFCSPPSENPSEEGQRFQISYHGDFTISTQSQILHCPLISLYTNPPWEAASHLLLWRCIPVAVTSVATASAAQLRPARNRRQTLTGQSWYERAVLIFLCCQLKKTRPLFSLTLWSCFHCLLVLSFPWCRLHVLWDLKWILKYWLLSRTFLNSPRNLKNKTKHMCEGQKFKPGRANPTKFRVNLFCSPNSQIYLATDHKDSS